MTADGARLLELLSSLIDHANALVTERNDLARRLADSQCDLNTVCHERDELVEEVANLTEEIEAMRAAVPA